MIKTVAVSNYRSLKNVIAPLSGLNVVTGSNGTGKSNLYKSLRFLSDAANNSLVTALAKDGGISSTFWAGPEKFTKDMLAGQAPVQGGPKTMPARLEFGFAGDKFGYSVSLGIPPPIIGPDPDPTMFSLDPVIRRECIWAGSSYRPATCLIDRQGPLVKIRDGRSWRVVAGHLSTFDSILTEVSDPESAPEVFHMRNTIKNWRFYDSFRTDVDSPIRQPKIGTFTPVLDHHGHGLVAALRTIHEIGDRQGMYDSINDAFPGATISMTKDSNNCFSLEFHQSGLLRPLKLGELSDGTLRYLLLIAALLTPRPPSLMVLNEPETSLHPDLLPALGRLIIKASKQTQVWVVSHATRLVATLECDEDCNSICLDKVYGETHILEQGMLDQPSWHWPS
ncbi:AAA family ATPase [Vibrio ziniensis]|uniref:AAA family ATPase n=1 Tax=Vibrio ziniensis TaxID=2711221 RepID=A0A6G7CP67_9VIBR|nr:AAA family ATPase [Vibrio ziniensis]QIH43874.1 AAA family ATPase [Vibrio ziniensis]